MAEYRVSMNFPLDDDGFLRRACPTCTREFKWLLTKDDESGVSSAEVLCPYCGKLSPSGQWFTAEQWEYIKSVALDEAFEKEVQPALDDLSNSLQQLSRSAGGLLNVSIRSESPSQRQASLVFEPNDMKIVEFTCHPAQQIKVQEESKEAVCCIVCGANSDVAP